MQCATLSSVACPALQHFSTLSQKWYDFRKKVIEHKTRVFSLRLLSETFFILRRNGRDMTKTLYWPSYKVAF